MVWLKAAQSNKHQINKPRKLIVYATIVAFATSPAGNLYAETPASCPTDNLDICTRYQHLAAEMDSNDLVVQLSSLRAASQELDPALRALIFGKALRSSDLRLRTAGLRYVLASRTRLAVTVDAPQHPTELEEKALQRLGLLEVNGIKLDEKSDEINARAEGGYNAKGAMVRGGFELGWGYCHMRMAATGEEDTLRGTVRCQFQTATPPTEFKASIELG